ncbi:translation initiation factor IF-2 [Mycoplasmoides alvi]|uniref:translation initiation factor IF-2 n=1 Tax=Mycoplasmoides alvi TaxID=78580 RepID=UPI00069802BD|nr:translation initiation factor IF-2 [Mycoplasmoides alvi]
MKKNQYQKKSKHNSHKIDSRDRTSIKDQLKSVDVGINNGVFIYKSPLTLGEFATQINQNVSTVIKHFFIKGKIVNFNTMLSIEQIGELCLEFNLDFKIETEVTKENILDQIKFDDDVSKMQSRPPIVTIMGHVDHGKTSLLDVIRKTNVVAGEHGGITQHIGAYQVNLNDRFITFIDTPGHEAFTNMRARGADITDIVILVVAADDGIKPQTEEAIDHATNAKVPIIVFINKMDKPEANPDKVMQQLTKYSLVPETWGGNTIVIQGSAYSNQGINELLQSILLLSDINEYKANYNAQAYGVVIEAHLSPGLGPLASVIIKRGTLKVGDYITLGAAYGKVRTMQNENGVDVIEATPSKPVKISGFDIVPEVGEKFIVLSTEQEVKSVSDSYKQKIQRQKHQALSTSLSLRDRIINNETKTLELILKADAQGSLEALKHTIGSIDIDGVTINIIRAGTGSISENDVKLAQASNGALIFGFNVSCTKSIKEMIDNAGLTFRNYNVIYNMINDIKSLLKGQLDPIYEDNEIGEAEVREIWKHSKIGTIAGCYVVSGKIKRNANCRIVRDGSIIYRSKINSLKSFNDTVNEVQMGHECGLTVENFNDIKKDDIIQIYETIQKMDE